MKTQFLIHGDDLVSSRNQLNLILNQFRQQQNLEIKYLEGKKLTYSFLEEILMANNLFNEKKVVVIERLSSLPVSNKKKEILSLLTSPNSKYIHPIVILENKMMTAAQLKPFSGWQISCHKLDQYLFRLVESLSPNNKSYCQNLLQKALVTVDAEFIFSMFIRQIRLLLAVSGVNKPTLPSWQLNKLNKQVSNFSQKQLLSLHHKMLVIDQQQKSSNNLLRLSDQLDLLILQL